MATSDNAIAKISLQINRSDHLLKIEPRATLLNVYTSLRVLWRTDAEWK
jgi:hypothetical protein